jgi:hypothetical protein
VYLTSFCDISDNFVQLLIIPLSVFMNQQRLILSDMRAAVEFKMFTFLLDQDMIMEVFGNKSFKSKV